MIFLYGYKAITNLTVRTEEISLIRFETQLQTQIRSIATDFGSVKKLELYVPSNHQQVCFVDFKKSPELFGLCQLNHPDYNPIVCDAWTDQTENVFLIPPSPKSIKVPSIDVDDGYLCLRTVNGRIVIRLEGKGKSALISKWDAG